MKKFIISLMAVAMVFAVIAPVAYANHPNDNLGEDSEAIIGFRSGPVRIDPIPCPDPYSHLFPPYCPWPGDPNDPNNPNLPGNMGFLVPRIDFGQHENQVGVNRLFYAIPAHGANRMLYGRLGQLTTADIIRANGSSNLSDPAETVGHFVQLTDHRGTFPGWRLTVQRSEFVSTYTGSTTSPLYGHALNGVEMRFGSTSSFAIGGGASNAVDQFIPATGVEVAVGTPVTIATAAQNRGGGTHRIQIGNATANLAQADLAHANRTTTSNPDGSTPFATAAGGYLARNEGISLDIPPTVPTYASDYIAELTWTVVLGP